jgi:uncharacterized protein with HEPN domain
MLLVAIGESCKKVDRLTDSKLFASYPEIDWKGIKGLRDVISHRYFDVDAEEIFMICTEHIPPLTGTIQKILASIR